MTKEIKRLRLFISSSQLIIEYNQEKDSPLLANLSDTERSELRALNESKIVLQQNIESLEIEIMQISATRENLRADLKNNYSKRKEEIESNLSSMGPTTTQSWASLAAMR